MHIEVIILKLIFNHVNIGKGMPVLMMFVSKLIFKHYGNYIGKK